MENLTFNILVYVLELFSICFKIVSKLWAKLQYNPKKSKWKMREKLQKLIIMKIANIYVKLLFSLIRWSKLENLRIFPKSSIKEFWSRILSMFMGNIRFNQTKQSAKQDWKFTTFSMKFSIAKISNLKKWKIVLDTF